jgi:molybdate/tungstate transport system substrate-binding protein
MGSTSSRVTLKIIPAGSLLYSLEAIQGDFEAAHPGVDVQVEGHGIIQAVRQVTDLHRLVDLVAVADESLIPELMYRPMEEGNENYSDCYVPFAVNEMVIAYTNRSHYAEEIAANNWDQVLSRSDVRVGLSNPMLDAAGYRALTIILLAERY